MSIQDIQKAIEQALEGAAEKEMIRSISLFGSQLHGDATSSSDVDLIVEFTPEAKVGFFKLYDLEELLSKNIGRKVDLTTPNGLHRYIRKQVLDEAKLIYEK